MFPACGTYPIPFAINLSARSPVMSSPCSRIDPPSTSAKPNIALIVVDLPDPFGPIIVTISPLFTTIEIPRAITVGP